MNENLDYISKNISIIMQGPLHVGNIVQIANHCRHWRQLFPEAEIIISISTNEAIESVPHHERDGNRRYRLLHWHVPNLIASNAVSIIDKNCDGIVLAEPGLPLPPIKPTDGPNNSDFMINAAKAGLEAATKKYVLRIRSDVIFINKNFVSTYLENVNLPRRFRSILSQRVLICNLFTVNPFCIERLPYHYSDWFNFGLLSDVRNIWYVDNMRYSDTVYYKLYPHQAGSNFRETNFNTRIGVEQHVYTSFLEKNNFDCLLDFHNDRRGIIESLMVLENEFIIGDAHHLKVLTQERSDYLTFDWVDYICIHHNQWRELFNKNPSEYRSVFLDKIEKSNEILKEQDPKVECINIKQEHFEIEEQPTRVEETLKLETISSFDRMEDNLKHKESANDTVYTPNVSITPMGKFIIPIYKVLLSPRMKKKFARNIYIFFFDSKNKAAKLIYKISYKEV